MKTVTEARQALDGAVQDYGDEHADRYSRSAEHVWGEYRQACDAYGDARELQGHAEACRRARFEETEVGQRLIEPVAYCGHDWYCKIARRLIDGDG